ncbi:MAG TPA: TAXI family TRAP transporter solute-binding subunit [Pseudolabrys sp.]|nr:TAXI family TRAP transporter solute-binding subunit [Pseudolabrys sp.]
MTALLLPLALTTAAISAEQGELDPGQVSEGLKAIFNYGKDTTSTKERLNANTTTVITGTIGGTYVQIGADLASVLDDGDKLRVLPIVGRGSVQSIADVLYLRGVDLGIMRSDTLDYLEKKGYASNLKSQLTYVTKLYNEEMHVVAPKSIKKLSDLEGKTVSVDMPNGGTFVTSIIVFERLGIKPNFVYIEQRRAYEKLRKGEIDAMIAVQGRPSKFISGIKDPNLHLIPVDYAAPLRDDYLPAQLTSKDYPALIQPGERVDTIAVPALLAAYNWPRGSARYKKVARFVEAFFNKFPDFQKPPFHPKWKEVVLNAPLKGWTRFPAAQEWLDEHANPAVSDLRNKFDRYMAARASANGGAAADPEQDAELFKQFMQWREETLASRAKARPHKRRSHAGKHSDDDDDNNSKKQ